MKTSGRSTPINLILCLCIFISMVSAAAAKTNDGGAVATVNGQAVLNRDFNLALEAAKRQGAAKGGPEGEGVELEKIEQLTLERLINFELLYQESRKLGLDAKPDLVDRKMADFKNQFPSEKEYQQFLQTNNLTESIMKEQMGRSMAVENLQKKLQHDFALSATPSDTELQSFYNDNLDKMTLPERVKASHILVAVKENAPEESKKAALAKIKRIQQQLKQGDNFAELAKLNSDCPSKVKGGDLDYFVRQQMVKPFADIAFATPVGQISDIVVTQFGYHLIKVTDKKPAEKITFSHLREKIANYLIMQQSEKLFREYVQKLHENAEIIRM